MCTQWRMRYEHHKTMSVESGSFLWNASAGAHQKGEWVWTGFSGPRSWIRDRRHAALQRWPTTATEIALCSLEAAFSFLIGFVGCDDGRHGGAPLGQALWTSLLRFCVCRFFDRWRNGGVLDPLREECVTKLCRKVEAWGAVDGDLWCIGCR